MNTRRQVLGSFDPASVTWEQAKSRSYELKTIGDRISQLQAYNVKLAKVKIFSHHPVHHPDAGPLEFNHKSGLYAGVGLYVPVWDGFKRIRNVSRQKAVLKQYDSRQRPGRKMNWKTNFSEAKDKVKETAYALQLAQSQIELVQLKARQHRNHLPIRRATSAGVLDSRKEVLEAKKTNVAQGTGITIRRSWLSARFREI